MISSAVLRKMAVTIIQQQTVIALFSPFLGSLNHLGLRLIMNDFGIS